jgi:hypothetical protein
VYDGETDARDVGPGHLGQSLAQRPVIVVAVHADQPPGACLEQVQQCRVDPVAGVHDDVGGLDRRPEGMRYVTCPLRNVCVGGQHQRNRHDDMVAGDYFSASADDRSHPLEHEDFL